MLYLFHGEDTIRSLNKLNELVQNLLKKKGNNSSFFEINEDNFEESYFKNLIHGSHLFGEKNLVVLKKVFENRNLADYFERNMTNLSVSPNIFIFWEETPDKEILALFQKEAEKIWQFKKPRDRKKQADKETAKKIFQIIDAFSQRKPRLAWLLFQKALLDGIDEEEVFWKIFWQTKNLVGLKPHQNEPENLINKKIKLHPYVMRKCLQVLPLFKKEELEMLSKQLLQIYQDNRYNKIELSFGIEKMLLNL